MSVSLLIFQDNYRKNAGMHVNKEITCNPVKQVTCKKQKNKKNTRNQITKLSKCANFFNLTLLSIFRKNESSY